jgi:hypothetical protein
VSERQQILVLRNHVPLIEAKYRSLAEFLEGRSMMKRALTGIASVGMLALTVGVETANAQSYRRYGPRGPISRRPIHPKAARFQREPHRRGAPDMGTIVCEQRQQGPVRMGDVRQQNHRRHRHGRVLSHHRRIGRLDRKVRYPERCRPAPGNRGRLLHDGPGQELLGPAGAVTIAKMWSWAAAARSRAKKERATRSRCQMVGSLR